MKKIINRWISSIKKRRICADLAPSVEIAPTGTIENCSGIRERVSIGEHSVICGRLMVYGHGGRIQIGDWSYVSVRSEIWSMESITIGDRVLISHDVNINDGSGHSLKPDERHEHHKKIIESGHPHDPGDLPGVKSDRIIIEDDVWISFGVTIMKGVRIGKGSVIGANAIVTKDVPPGVLYYCEVKPKIRPLQFEAEPASGRTSKE